MSKQFVQRAHGQRGVVGSTEAAAARRARFDAYLKEVKRSVYGNWGQVMPCLAPALQAALEAGPTKHVHCPVHGGKHGDAFRLMNDFSLTGGTVCNTCGTFADGFATLRWMFGWEFVKAVKEVGAVIGLPYGDGHQQQARPATVRLVATAVPAEDPAKVAERDERNAAQMAALWSESVSILHPSAGIARDYLKNRGISKVFGTLDDLRFHPRVSYWENGVDIADYPAMLRLLRQPNGEPMTIERLYLSPDGRKAPVEKQKKIMPRRSTAEYHGSCVRLDHEVGTVLCVAEGVETALSYRAMLGLPTWATTVAGLMETLMIPSHVELVLIAADLDPPQTSPQGAAIAPRGQAAAETLAQRIRAAGRRAAVHVPPFELPPGVAKLDWNDVLQSYGIDEARKQPFVLKTRERVAVTLDEMGYQWDSSHAHY